MLREEPVFCPVEDKLSCVTVPVSLPVKLVEMTMLEPVVAVLTGAVALKSVTEKVAEAKLENSAREESNANRKYFFIFLSNLQS